VYPVNTPVDGFRLRPEFNKDPADIVQVLELQLVAMNCCDTLDPGEYGPTLVGVILQHRADIDIDRNDNSRIRIIEQSP
jgi:hypothetical protein